MGHWYQLMKVDKAGYDEAKMREYRFATEVYPKTKKGAGSPALDERGFPTTTYLKRQDRPFSLLEMEQMVEHGWEPGDRTKGKEEELPCLCQV